MANPVIEKAVKYYKSDLINHAGILSNAQSSLRSKLSDFTTEKSKFEFLSLLRNAVFVELEDHKKECTMKVNCGTQEKLENALFAVDEQFDSLKSYYIPPFVGEDEFSHDDISTVSSKLDDIKETLRLSGYADEIIAEEIEELKEQLHNLGKKNWLQLAKGKLIDLGWKFMIDPSLLKEVFLNIAHDFGITKFLS